MLAAGSLRLFPAAVGNITGPTSFGAVFREPCIVLASDASCQGGDSPHFVQLFGPNPRNTIILVEPPFVDPADVVLRPYAPIACRVVSCPLDPRANAQQLGELLDKTADIGCVVHYGQTKPACGKVEFRPIRDLETVTIPLKRRFVRATISPELARTIAARPVGSALDHSMFVAEVACIAQPNRSDGSYSLSPARVATDSSASKSAAAGPLWGTPQATTLLEAFARRGVTSVVPLATAPGRVALRVGGFGSFATIIVADGETTITSNSDALKDLLTKAITTDCLKSFTSC
jgi:hypothetical protein